MGYSANASSHDDSIFCNQEQVTAAADDSNCMSEYRRSTCTSAAYGSSHEGSSCRSRRCHQLERKQEAQATWLDSRVSPGQQCQRPEEVENKTNAPEKGSGQKKTERQATNSTITNGLAQAPRSCDGLAQSNQQQAARRQQAAAVSGTVQAVAAGRRLQQDATQQ
jgi:hypothetical protein